MFCWPRWHLCEVHEPWYEAQVSQRLLQLCPIGAGAGGGQDLGLHGLESSQASVACYTQPLFTECLLEAGEGHQLVPVGFALPASPGKVSSGLGLHRGPGIEVSSV